MSALNLYKSYNFVDKDPVIDLMRGLIQDQKAAYGRLSYDSGVSEATLRNWFDGKTKRPQFATVAAVMSALGYRMHWQLEGNPSQHVTLEIPAVDARATRAPARPKDPDRQLAAQAHIRQKLSELAAPAAA